MTSKNHEHRWDDHLEPALANDEQGNPVRARVWYRVCSGCDEKRVKKVEAIEDGRRLNVQGF